MKNFLWQNHPWLVVSVILLITMFLGEQTLSQFQYQRQMVLDGQIYRLLTAHFVHTNLYHTLLNLAGLIIIGLLANTYLIQKDWWVVLLVSAIFVGGGLILLDQNVQWYRGLSGILHGVVVLMILKARQLASMIRAIILVGLGVKLMLEQMHTGLWQSEQLIGAPVIVNAHLYGVMGGTVSYLILRQTQSKRMFRENF